MPDEVTAADIARLAGVGRAAVSNWRRRYDDFPRPVGGPPTSPTFALPDVEAWLEANGKLTHEDSPARPRLDPGAEVVANIVANLLPPEPPGVILDPACGPGQMLAAAARRFGPSVAYLGQDADRHNVDTATRALADAGAPGAKVLPGTPLLDDALARYRGAADVVVCLPPGKSPWLSDDATRELPWEFGPPSQLDPFLAWPQLCYAYLKPGGTAVIAVPSSVSVRASGRRIRAEMLRAGALREVVALPEGLVAHTSVPWQLWILQRPADRPTYTVRLVDLTGTTAPTTAHDWRAVYADSERTRKVNSIELLDEDVLLVPARHIDTPARDVGPEYNRLRTDVAKLAATLDANLPAFRRGGAAIPPLSTVIDLVRQGAVSFVDKGAQPQAGDVLVPSGPGRFDATVLADPVRDRVSGDVLRCEPTALDPYFLACFLRSEANRRQAAGTLGGTPRLDVRRARIPRLPLSEQRQYGEAFRRLTAITDRIDAVRALAAEAVRTAVYGLTSGVLAAGMPRGDLPR